MQGVVWNSRRSRRKRKKEVLTCARRGGQGVKRLAPELGRCKTLTYLRATDNEIGDEGAAALAAELFKCAASPPILVRVRDAMARRPPVLTEVLYARFPRFQVWAAADFGSGGQQGAGRGGSELGGAVASELGAGHAELVCE